MTEKILNVEIVRKPAWPFVVIGLLGLGAYLLSREVLFLFLSSIFISFSLALSLGVVFHLTDEPPKPVEAAPLTPFTPDVPDTS